MQKRDVKMQKWKEKRWKRINKRIERGVAFLVIMATVVLSVLEILEKGDKVFTLKNLLYGGNHCDQSRKCIKYADNDCELHEAGMEY